MRARRLAPRQPRLDGRRDRAPLPHARPRDAAARVLRLEPGRERRPPRALAVAGSPPIIPRFSWGADESIRRAPPQYATPSTSPSSTTRPARTPTRATQSAAIVRGIEVYHVKGNGWNDIGYNFLVDKYGQVFEGRYGGVDKAVIGAHAEGFNTGSVGVAVLGDYGATPISRRREDVARAAARVAARPRARRSALDARRGRPDGNPRFPSGRAGVPARDLRAPRHGLHRLSRERAVRASCPRSRRTSRRSAVPKLYAPVGARQLGRARCASRRGSRVAQPWTVTVARLGRRAGGAGHRHAAPRSTGRGTRPRRRPTATPGRSRRRALVRRPVRSAPVAALAAAEGDRVAGARSRPGETDDVRVHAHRARRRSPRRSSTPPAQTLSTLLVAAEARRRADVRLHSRRRGSPNGAVHAAARGDRERRQTVTASVPFAFDDARRLRVAGARSLASGGASSQASRSRARRFALRSRCCAARPSSRRPPSRACRPARSRSRGTGCSPTGRARPTASTRSRSRSRTTFGTFTRTADVTLDTTPPAITRALLRAICASASPSLRRLRSRSARRSTRAC